MAQVPKWRKQIGQAQNYRGHSITVHAMAPDVIAAVDGNALPNYYLTAEAGRQAGMRYADQLEEEKAKRGRNVNR